MYRTPQRGQAARSRSLRRRRCARRRQGRCRRRCRRRALDRPYDACTGHAGADLLSVVFAHAVDARPAPPERHTQLALKHLDCRRALPCDPAHVAGARMRAPARAPEPASGAQVIVLHVEATSARRSAVRPSAPTPNSDRDVENDRTACGAAATLAAPAGAGDAEPDAAA
jgi:hypothetical protein